MRIVLMVSLIVASIAVRSVQAAESQTSSALAQPQRVTLKWLGTAGWEIQFAQTKILIDPFLTRKQPVAGEEWKTDEEAVLNVIGGADYIFAGHSHADHIADIPFIAKHFGAKVIGSRTTINLCLSAGVDKAQLTTISGGEKLDYKDFSVQVIESQTRHVEPARSEKATQVRGNYQPAVRTHPWQTFPCGWKLPLLLHISQTSLVGPEHR